jgi:glycine cleavage system H protein
MNIPADLKYTKEHEWIRVEGNIGYIGITDFAQGELGELVYVEIDTVGEELSQDDVFGTVEAVKTTSELFMPISGKILEFNEELDESKGDNPAAINEDPYGNGWIVKVEISNASELDGLLSSDEYSALVGA